MNPKHDAQGNVVDPEEIESDEIPQLNEVLEFYQAYDLLPLAHHIVWLSSVRDAIGTLDYFDLSFSDIKLLIVLQDEKRKKEAYDVQRSKERSDSITSQASSLASKTNKIR